MTTTQQTNGSQNRQRNKTRITDFAEGDRIGVIYPSAYSEWNTRQAFEGVVTSTTDDSSGSITVESDDERDDGTPKTYEVFRSQVKVSTRAGPRRVSRETAAWRAISVRRPDDPVESQFTDVFGYNTGQAASLVDDESLVEYARVGTANTTALIDETRLEKFGYVSLDEFAPTENFRDAVLRAAEDSGYDDGMDMYAIDVLGTVVGYKRDLIDRVSWLLDCEPEDLDLSIYLPDYADIGPVRIDVPESDWALFVAPWAPGKRSHVEIVD